MTPIVERGRLRLILDKHRFHPCQHTRKMRTPASWTARAASQHTGASSSDAPLASTPARHTIGSIDDALYVDALCVGIMAAAKHLAEGGPPLAVEPRKLKHNFAALPALSPCLMR